MNIRGWDRIGRAAKREWDELTTIHPSDRPWQMPLAAALGLMFVLAFGLTSFGVILAARVRSFEGFGVFSNTIILPLYFTSSSVFPLDPSLTRTQMVTAYPEWLVFLMQVNPITYAVDALRGIIIGFNQFPPHYGLAVIFGMAVVFFLVALVDFSRS